MSIENVITIIFIVLYIIIIFILLKDVSVDKNTKNNKYTTNIVYADGEIIGETKNIELAFQSSGIIEKIYIKEGDIVKKNDILVSLDNSILEKELEIAEIILKQNNIELKRIQKINQILNNDVPEYLEKLRKFEEESRKINIIVK